MEGFVDVDISQQQYKICIHTNQFFPNQQTHWVIFTNMDVVNANPDEIIVTYDTALQNGRVGMIRSPYLLLRCTAAEKKYLDLMADHKAEIDALITR